MPSIRKILVPTDFSPSAAEAAAYGADLAQAFGAELLLMHVVPEANYPMINVVAIRHYPGLREELHKHATAELEELAKKLAPKQPVRKLLADGMPHAEILAAAAAESVDLIVMGTHGHTGIKHAVLGSTAERVVRLARCPVLTLRQHPKQ